MGDVPKEPIHNGRHSAIVGAIDRDSKRILAKCRVSIMVVGAEVEEPAFSKVFHAFTIAKHSLSAESLNLTLEENFPKSAQVHVLPNSVNVWRTNTTKTFDEKRIRIIANQIQIQSKDIFEKDIEKIQFRLQNRDSATDQTLVEILFSVERSHVLSELYRRAKPQFIAPWTSESEKIQACRKFRVILSNSSLFSFKFWKTFRSIILSSVFQPLIH